MLRISSLRIFEISINVPELYWWWLASSVIGDSIIWDSSSDSISSVTSCSFHLPYNLVGSDLSCKL